ncbi:hypothetical protein KAI04_05260 [Candidatus Pacearchaeota archaeon]|nr:hypothetical protein [Candidatus Pacearchaeota archaeon]
MNDTKEHPKNYHYPLFLIQIAVSIKLTTSAGFRAIQKIIAIYNLYLSLSLKAPSYGTILIWVKKLGYHQLEETIEKANDWIIILDESVEFGHEKLLVIYGVRSSQIDFSRALIYKDLTPLSIIAGESWTGKLIEKEIKKIENKIGKIIYAVADGGNAIKNSLKCADIPHVYDITHKFAWFLKEVYKEDREFISYTKTMAAMRGKLALSNVSHILPPNQRCHSRFMNLEIISDWGMKVINYLKRSEKNEKEHIKLKWVFGFKGLIIELSQVSKIINIIMGIIKTEGLSEKSIRKSMKKLNLISIDNQRIRKLKSNIVEYLKKCKKLIPEQDKILCTSDIIESSFGKYKNYLNKNPMTGITNLSLCISAFTSNLDAENVKQAMEHSRNIDIAKWTKHNIGITNLAKRKYFLQKEGCEKILEREIS